MAQSGNPTDRGTSQAVLGQPPAWFAEVIEATVEPQVTDQSREHERSNVFLGAVLSAAGKSIPVRVRNLSVAGALLDGSDLPPEGVRVELRRGTLAVRGEVAWAGGAQRGIRFNGPIDVASWVRPIGHAAQRKVDRAVESIRLGRLPSNPEPKTSEVQDLVSLSDQIREIAEKLACSSNVSTETAEQLLKLDAIAHTLLQLARPSRS